MPDAMDELPQEDWLDAQLREETPYIDDAGFTAAVLHKLPAHRARRSFRGFILLALTLLACLAAYFISDGGRFIILEAERLVAMPLIYICAIALLCTAVVTASGAAAAYFVTGEKPIEGFVRLFR